MTKHKGGTTYFSTVPGRAAHNKKKKEILGPFASALGLDEAALLKSSPDKSPSQAAAQKMQAPVRGRIARTKRNKINASLAASTLKRSLGIAPSISVKKFLAGKKRKSRKRK
jgi:hypothetical protein